MRYCKVNPNLANKFKQVADSRLTELIEHHNLGVDSHRNEINNSESRRKESDRGARNL